LFGRPDETTCASDHCALAGIPLASAKIFADASGKWWQRFLDAAHA
jgi:hypothetical protein